MKGLSGMGYENVPAALASQIIDIAPTILLVAAAPDFRIVCANRAAQRAARRSEESLIGIEAADVFAFVDPNALRLACSRRAPLLVVAGGEQRESGRWEVFYQALDTPEGGQVLVSAVPRPGEAAQSVGVTANGLEAAAQSLASPAQNPPESAQVQRAQGASSAIVERLRAVLLQIPAAIFILDAPDGRVAFKSHLVDELLGHADIDPANATLRGWAVHQDGSPYELWEYPSRRALFHGETVRAEPMTYRRGDGQIIHLEMHAGPVRNESGEVIAAVAVAMNVTERHVTEARLRQSEERLRLVMDSTGLGTWEYDALSGTNIRSRRHDEIFGYAEPVSEWSQERFQSHIPLPDRTRVEEGLRAALEQGKDLDVECRMVRVDGSRGWLKIGARPHYGSDGKVARLIGTVADITERKQSEHAAMETAAKFEMLAQALPSMVWTSMPDGRIDWFNARVPEYCGIPDAELKPDGWTPVHPDDVATSTARWLECLASGDPYVIEYRIRRHDGMYRWHITRAVPIHGPDGSISRWIGASADIQDQKSSEEALAVLNATLEKQVRERTAELLAAEATLRQSQKMEAVGQLTGGLAHDFNNLLTGITGSLELMASRLRQGRVGELDRYLQVAQGAAKRAAALTHRLLAFSRRQTLDPKPTDVNHLVTGMGELIRRTVGPAVAVTIAGAPALWPVRVDPNQLESALLNLCINARDAMPDGGSLIVETSNLALADHEAKELELHAGDYVLMCVSDTGGGMSADVLERAFDPFFTTKPIGEGTGLGLSMVYGFVRQSGGQARIHSQPGKGTRVCLYLPRYGGGEKVIEPAAGARKPQRGGGETVLVVDDESSVRTLINDVLVELGYTVLQAEHGAGGLQVLESNDRVDLLITDVGLPGGMNGRQLADAALVRRPHLKVLFVTGYAENAVIGEGHLKPGMHILTKPFSLETLGSRISEIIAAE
jgi:PAS domain S-box-containing protein